VKMDESSCGARLAWAAAQPQLVAAEAPGVRTVGEHSAARVVDTVEAAQP
jgi:hypothetical protein